MLVLLRSADISEKSILVVCGLEGIPCPALRAIQDQQKQNNVVPLWSCPIKISEGLFHTNQILSCENRTLQLIDRASETAAIGLQILDPSSTKEMMQVMDSIWSVQLHQANFLAEENFVMYYGNGVDGQPQKNVLRRLRSNVKQDPMTLTRFEITGVSDGRALDFELLTLNDWLPALELLELEKEFQDELEKMDVQVHLRTMLGGILARDWYYDAYVYESLFDYGERSCGEKGSCRNGVDDDETQTSNKGMESEL